MCTLALFSSKSCNGGRPFLESPEEPRFLWRQRVVKEATMGHAAKKTQPYLLKKKKKSNKIGQILFHLYEVPRIAKFVETESRAVVARV